MNDSLNIKQEIAPKKLAFIYVILMVVTCFSLLYGWVPVLYKQAYIGVVALLAAVLIVPKYFKTKLFVVTLFYAMVVWMNAQMGDEYVEDKVVMDGLMLVMSGSIACYLMKSNDQKVKKWISVSIMAILIIQTIPGLILYVTSGDTIRNFIGLINLGESDFEWGQLYRLGIMAYAMTHSLPVMVPPLMMWIRKKEASRKWKFFCLITLVCIFLLTIIYDVTTVQFLVVFCIAASLLIHPDNSKRNKQRIVLVAFIILPFVVSSQLQESALRLVETVAPGEMKGKVADMRYNLTHNDDTGDMGTREKFYTNSIDCFVESPLFGTNDFSRIGNHSSVFDRLGAFGLVGFLPYIVIIIISSRLWFLNLPIHSRWYFIISTISFIVLLIIKNMSHIEVWLTYLVVSPSLLSIDPSMFMRKGYKNTKE